MVVVILDALFADRVAHALDLLVQPVQFVYQGDASSADDFVYCRSVPMSSSPCLAASSCARSSVRRACFDHGIDFLGTCWRRSTRFRTCRRGASSETCSAASTWAAIASPVSAKPSSRSSGRISPWPSFWAFPWTRASTPAARSVSLPDRVAYSCGFSVLSEGRPSVEVYFSRQRSLNAAPRPTQWAPPLPERTRRWLQPLASPTSDWLATCCDEQM